MRTSGSSTALEQGFASPVTSTGAPFRPAPEFDVGPAFQPSNTDKPPFARRNDQYGAGPNEVSFGTFRLLPTQFLLLEGDKPVPLGSRALYILIALVEHPGELVSKQALMARVWPNVFVEPANLTVHISALRRMLRDGRDGNRFIINIPGRGYRFVAPLEHPIQNIGPQEPTANAPSTAGEFQRRSQNVFP